MSLCRSSAAVNSEGMRLVQRGWVERRVVFVKSQNAPLLLSNHWAHLWRLLHLTLGWTSVPLSVSDLRPLKEKLCHEVWAGVVELKAKQPAVCIENAGRGKQISHLSPSIRGSGPIRLELCRGSNTLFCTLRSIRSPYCHLWLWHKSTAAATWEWMD